MILKPYKSFYHFPAIPESNFTAWRAIFMNLLPFMFVYYFAFFAATCSTYAS